GPTPARRGGSRWWETSRRCPACRPRRPRSTSTSTRTAAPLASSEPLAAGPAIVRTLELAAGLALLTARVAGRDDLAARAEALGAELAPLAAEDADAYLDYLATHSDQARARTIELPLRMAGVR